jgi:predicted acyltransferase (DUF342 family)
MKDDVKGSNDIKTKKTGSRSLVHQYYVEGQKKQKFVAREAYAQLGFYGDMNFIQAKEHCKILNRTNSREKEAYKNSARRLADLKSLDVTLESNIEIKLSKKLI